MHWPECANLETDLGLGIFSITKSQCSTRPLPLTAALRTLLTLPALTVELRCPSLLRHHAARRKYLRRLEPERPIVITPRIVASAASMNTVLVHWSGQHGDEGGSQLSGETLPRQQRIHLAFRVQENGRSPGRSRVWRAESLRRSRARRLADLPNHHHPTQSKWEY